MINFWKILIEIEAIVCIFIAFYNNVKLWKIHVTDTL